MAAQAPQSFHDRPSRPPKPFHLHQAQILLRVVLSMGALCLLEVDHSLAQDRLGSDRPVPSDGSAKPHSGDYPAAPGDQLISELELLKEESVALREESASIAHGMYPGKPQPISQAPSNVYVITDEDIRHSGATDIPQVLRRIPGLEVIQMTGADYNVSVRGDNQPAANKLLVMIDGRSIYEDAYGSVFWTTLPVTLPEIKRIEVLKGPASALYGFNAFDGVINIITKSPEEIKGTTVQVGGGELGTIRAAAIQAGTYNKLGYRLSIGHDQNQQWRNRDALALRQTKFNLHTDYALSSDSRVVVQGGYLANNRFDGQFFETIAETTTGINSGYLNAMYERPNFFIRAWWQYWRHEDDETVFPSIQRFFRIIDRNGNIEQNRQRNTYNIDAQHTIPFGSSHRFTYGANLRYTRFTSNFILGDAAREDRVGLYVQEEWQPIKQLTAMAGVRFDMHSQINPTYSPRASLVYSPTENHSFRISGSVAYRPPTLYESFIESHSLLFLFGCPPNCVGIPNIFVGSKNLKPEQIISYEAEYQGWYLRHRLRTRAALFYNQLSDMITFNIPTPVNSGKADIYGGEAGVEFLATKWLTGFANFSYEQIGQNLTGTTRRGAPRWKSNAGLRTELDNGLNGEAAVHYVDSAVYPIGSFFTTAQNLPLGTPPGSGPPAPNTRVGSYVLLNVRVGYFFWHDRAEAAFAVFNALNDKHKEHPLGDTIGSRVMGWLTVRY
ncbi:TonB-dependent receptor plug domain-containing protein [Nitrospira sp. Nam80]